MDPDERPTTPNLPADELDEEDFIEVRLLPMTKRQKEEQALDFCYDNLASSTTHKPVRSVFESYATGRWYGWTAADFDAWARGRQWGA